MVSYIEMETERIVKAAGAELTLENFVKVKKLLAGVIVCAARDGALVKEAENTLKERLLKLV